ncbi:metallophosphoesterase [Elusimicrobiota bacterium]
MKNIKNTLIDFTNIEKHLENVSQINLGIKTISIFKIVGSLGRYDDFSEGFLAKKEKSSLKYESVKDVMLSGKILPPIKVYQILDNYFIIDGHHRVTVAVNELGAKEIDAEVIKIRFKMNLSVNRKYQYNTDRARRFLIKLEEDEFQKNTCLINDVLKYPLKVTDLTSFAKLHEEILNFKKNYKNGELSKKSIIYSSYLWYEKRFLPTVEVILAEDILTHFKGRTYTDLYIWIQEHKYYLSKKSGHKVGFDFTKNDFLQKYRRSKFFELIPDVVVDIVKGIKNEIVGKGKKKLKILAVSDTRLQSLEHCVENSREKYNDIDCIVSCGDLAKDYLELIVDSLKKTMFFVSGNHDISSKNNDDLPENEILDITRFSEGKNVAHVAGYEDLGARIEIFKDYIFVGFKGSMWYNGNPNQYTGKQMNRIVRSLEWEVKLYRLKEMLLGRKKKDIIVISHAPIFGIHDEDNICHTGFKCFKRFIKNVSPLLWLHGHVHILDSNKPQITKIDNTTVINCYGSKIIDIKDGVVNLSEQRCS